jgi:hypothetical protein
MNVSPDAAELLAEIRELRSARRERLARDLAVIDAAYDRAVRRAHAGPIARTMAMMVRVRACRRAKLRQASTRKPR